MANKSKILRQQKEFLKAMKEKFQESPKTPPESRSDNGHPTILVGRV